MSESRAVTISTLLGLATAGTLSWMKWHSVGLCILHAGCGWIYVIVYLIRYGIHNLR
jgi:hypothetical protein